MDMYIGIISTACLQEPCRLGLPKFTRCIDNNSCVAGDLHFPPHGPTLGGDLHFPPGGPTLAWAEQLYACAPAASSGSCIIILGVFKTPRPYMRSFFAQRLCNTP